jgi:nickel-dependent lactate racemase
MFARALKKCQIYIVHSKIDPHLLESMFFKTSDSIEEALEMAYREKGSKARLLFIPNAIDCIPELAD